MGDCNEGVWVWVLDVSAHISPQYRSGEQSCECLVGHNYFVVCLPPPSPLLLLMCLLVLILTCLRDC